MYFGFIKESMSPATVNSNIKTDKDLYEIHKEEHMKYIEFMNRVQEYGNLKNLEEAVRITEAVLETLGERVYRTESLDLAAQLPKDLKMFLFKKQLLEQSRDEVKRFSLEEFYNRVRARARIGYPEAIKQSKAVMAVLQEAVSAGELDDIKNELPDEFNDLFQKSIE
ncbi:MAG: DUF2267 domain-containing protein [wastewater metagenome]|nr:DUF2267 domain-containing protein [Candidatus Loosdrechtia aerotolerans]